jgi:hypothetical protein
MTLGLFGVLELGRKQLERCERVNIVMKRYSMDPKNLLVHPLKKSSGRKVSVGMDQSERIFFGGISKG